MRRFRALTVLGGVILLWIVASLFMTTQSSAQDYDLSDYRKTLIQLLGVTHDSVKGRGDNLSIFQQIADSDDTLYIAPLIDLAYFARGSEISDAILVTLADLSDQPIELGWRGYFEWAGKNNIALPPSYDEYKGLLLSIFVDPEFARFFPAGVMDTAKVNLVEPVWGGVTVDGIPSLVNAKQISPDDARAEGNAFSQFCRDDDCSYPAQDELVFGVSINGDNRAYPLRLLNWHEMFNDVIGWTPLFDNPDGEQVCNFRAPTPFQSTGRSGDDWVYINGESADCPPSGWVNASALEWENGDWEAIKSQLPDFTAGQDALSTGIVGHVIGKPVMLAYCTLCGSGILYDVTISDLHYIDFDGQALDLGETVLEFGSSGMLMRSNKLMYDRNTDTVWNALTGVPAFGLLASSGIELDVLPVVVIDWATWLEEHPDTSVLSLATGYTRSYINGGAYGDYFNSPDLMFPSWQQDTTIAQNKDVVFAIRIDDTAKAYPLAKIIPEVVVNDTINETALVVIAHATPDRDFFEPGGAAVRAYERAGYQFSTGETDETLISGDGRTWQITEDALVSADGESLPRLGGHLAFWFGWYGFYPDTLVYGE